jgi:four helix bundle protein
MPFDHEKLDVYRLSLDLVSRVTELCDDRTISNRHIKDQLSRASLSVPLNIAEGNGKRSFRDRSRFFDIARGSAMECAALLDVLQIYSSESGDRAGELKNLLLRIVAMLTRMGDPRDAGRKRGGDEFDA